MCIRDSYEISKTRKYKNDIGKIENMEYDVKTDIYTCRNGKKLGVDHIQMCIRDRSWGREL